MAPPHPTNTAGNSGSHPSDHTPAGHGAARVDPGRKDVADKLRQARALIEHGWTQKVYAFGKRREVSYDSRWAVCYCAMGAIGAASHHYPSSTLPGVEELHAAIFGRRAQDEASILIWNDEPLRTQAEVLAAFDRAIELAEKSA